jgi:hypothetical protein
METTMKNQCGNKLIINENIALYCVRRRGHWGSCKTAHGVKFKPLIKQLERAPTLAEQVNRASQQLARSMFVGASVAAGVAVILSVIWWLGGGV